MRYKFLELIDFHGRGHDHVIQSSLFMVPLNQANGTSMPIVIKSKKYIEFDATCTIRSANTN